MSGSHGYAVALFCVDDSAIRHNSLRDNDHGVLCDACLRDSIDGNAVSHSAGSSIDFGDGAADNRIRHNRLTDNGDGIIATDAHDNLVSGNRVTGTGFFGAPDTGGFGLILDGAAHNTITHNVISGGRGPAVLVTSLDSPALSQGNLISRNTVTSRLADGILLGNGATENEVIRNRASRNGDDGIDADATTTVTSNVADRNGNPAQCTGIACQP